MESLLIVVAGVLIGGGIALLVSVFFDAPNDFYEGQ